MFLGKDGAYHTECRKVQCHHLLVELFRQEMDIVLAGRGFIPIPEQYKLRPHVVREKTQHQIRSDG